jgi:hypothetical protein
MTTIASKELVTLAGMTERRLRQLATEGKLPEPKRGQWQYPETVQRLIEHLRKLSEHGALAQAKLEREQAKARLAIVAADLAEKKTVLRADAARAFRNSIIAAKQKFYQAESTIQVESGLKLAMPSEAQVKLREIIHAHHRRALSELFRNELGPIICPACKKEITNEK